MRRRQGVTRWILIGVGALVLLLAAFGIVRIAAVWHLVGSLAR
jgi:succinate dehydrogenase hydrophobic anchor subunit